MHVCLSIFNIVKNYYKLPVFMNADTNSFAIDKQHLASSIGMVKELSAKILVRSP